MVDADFALMMEILRKLQAQSGEVLLRLGDINTRLSSLEESSAMTSVRLASLETTVAGVNKRLDRHEHRLDRIETRLGLIDA